MIIIIRNTIGLGEVLSADARPIDIPRYLALAEEQGAAGILINTDDPDFTGYCVTTSPIGRFHAEVVQAILQEVLDNRTLGALTQDQRCDIFAADDFETIHGIVATPKMKHLAYWFDCDQ